MFFCTSCIPEFVHKVNIKESYDYGTEKRISINQCKNGGIDAGNICPLGMAIPKCRKAAKISKRRVFHSLEDVGYHSVDQVGTSDTARV